MRTHTQPTTQQIPALYYIRTYDWFEPSNIVHGSADTLDVAKAKAKKVGGDVVEVDTSDEINGYYKIKMIHLHNGKTMDPAKNGLEDRWHPTKGLSIGGSGLGLSFK